ncbi:uncharacterized mitochondrial protein AtMg00810-like [Dioscorea cayenensis subsp. rotundata]|uniref:Uncharacterized mitochondrial protein AtMg00810-like n=1 Tax=Dioscorea cayennensis subsp. rotundata TaxID=55577 RepID=A0AB40CDE0_DIOCR|nr:uncharacterized mitochondrial protein AtMg00810-like [Dioscorea cayenensis subsp. rotundata]
MLMEFKEEMLRTFEMSDLGPLRYFLGLEVKQKPGSLFVSQHKYAEDLLKKTRMLHSKAISTPMNSNEKLYVKDNSGNTDSSRYRRIVGSLLYLTHTRPDLMYAVGVVSRFMQAPTSHHMGAVKRILHYISRTMSFGLLYTHNDQFKLTGYTDSDWGARRTTGRAPPVGFFRLDQLQLPGARRSNRSRLCPVLKLSTSLLPRWLVKLCG